MFNKFGLHPTKLDAPYPAWSQKNIQIVESAIASAWKMIVDSALLQNTLAVHLLSDAAEVQISVQLIEILESFLNSESIHGFNGRVFSPPARGQELANVSYSELEKRADISIRFLSSQPYTEYNSLFFECKRISAKRLVSDYVNEGLIKFCDQRYAWAMPHAGMLAYVQNLSPVPCAKTELEKYWRKNPDSHAKPVYGLIVENTGDVSVTISKHKRSKPLPNGKASSDITIRHLWLSA